MSFLTCFWLFPQNEHFSRSPLSPMRATRRPPNLCVGRCPRGCTCSGGSTVRRYPPDPTILSIESPASRPSRPCPLRADNSPTVVLDALTAAVLTFVVNNEYR